MAIDAPAPTLALSAPKATRERIVTLCWPTGRDKPVVAFGEIDSLRDRDFDYQANTLLTTPGGPIFNARGNLIGLHGHERKRGASGVVFVGDCLDSKLIATLASIRRERDDARASRRARRTSLQPAAAFTDGPVADFKAALLKLAPSLFRLNLPSGDSCRAVALTPSVLATTALPSLTKQLPFGATLSGQDGSRLDAGGFNVSASEEHRVALVRLPMPGLAPAQVEADVALGTSLAAIFDAAPDYSRFGTGRLVSRLESGELQYDIDVPPGSAGAAVATADGRVVGIHLGRRDDGQAFGLGVEALLRLVGRLDEPLPVEDATASASLPTLSVPLGDKSESGGGPSPGGGGDGGAGPLPSRSPFILVAGPTDPTGAQLDRASELARWLAREGFSLVTGAFPGIDEAAQRVFGAELGAEEADRRLRIVRSSHRLTPKTRGRILEADGTDQELALKCELAAAAVLIGNGLGPVAVAKHVVRLRKPAFSLAGTGAETLSTERLQKPSLERLYAELSRLREAPAPSADGPRVDARLVLVTGPEQATIFERAAAERIARWLAEHGFGLLTGGYPGVDAAAAVAFAGAVPPDSLQGRLVQVVARARAPATALGQTVWVAREDQEYERSAALADCAVVVGNSSGTAGMASFVRAQRKPVLAYPGTGADAIPALGMERFATETALFDELAEMLQAPAAVGAEPPTNSPDRPAESFGSAGTKERVVAPLAPPEPVAPTTAGGVGPGASTSTSAEPPVMPPGEPPAPLPPRGAAAPDAGTLTLRVADGKARLELPSGKDWSGALGALRIGEKVATAKEATADLPYLAETEAKELGDGLEAALFGGPPPAEVTNALTADLGQTRRLVLELDPAAAALPWEYLRIGGQFLLQRRISVVRRVASAAPPRSTRLDTTRGLTLLFAWANPAGTTLDRFDDRAHTNQLERARPDGWTLKTLPAASPDRLRKQLGNRDDPFDIFHFLGHGRALRDQDVQLVLHPDDAKGTAEAVSSVELATWLGATKPRLVVLGACHGGAASMSTQISGIAEEIVRSTGIPVVAMQSAVPQDFSTEFLAEFYRCLADEQGDVEQAVHRARQISVGGRSLFGIPVLYAAAFDASPGPLEEPSFRFGPSVPWVSARELAGSLSEAIPKDARSVVEKAIQNLGGQKLFRSLAGAGAESIRGIVGELARVAEQERAIDPDERRAVRDALRSAKRQPRPVSVRADASEPLTDPPLARDWSKLRAALDDIGNRLIVPQGVCDAVAAELLAGRHVLLVGPVGTGKSSLAAEIVKAMGFDVFPATASSDWTPFEVVGGFFPQTVESRLELRFRPGCVTEAVLMNWEEPPLEGRHAWSRRLDGGTWLVLDELNRADMDRAMGPLFTALETRRLRLPVSADGDEAATTQIFIPQDFRILATLNGVDRHYLFRLSDALKRRFAWVEVPPTLEWKREWELLWKGDPADPAAEMVRRLVYLTRFVYPLGTAQLKAALAFLRAAQGSGLGDAARVEQAVLGSIFPSLEEAPESVHHVLLSWLEAAAADQVVAALEKAADETLGPPTAEAVRSLREALPGAAAAQQAAAALECVTTVGARGLPCPALVRWLRVRVRE